MGIDLLTLHQLDIPKPLLSSMILLWNYNWDSKYRM